MTAKEFLSSLPARVPLEAIEGVDTLFHFDISGDGGTQATIGIKDGQVKYEDGLQGEPKCVVKTSHENLRKLLSGSLNPMMAIMTGKVKISNTAEMMKYAKLFGLM
jgi:putative sterol carrier protein